MIKKHLVLLNVFCCIGFTSSEVINDSYLMGEWVKEHLVKTNGPDLVVYSRLSFNPDGTFALVHDGYRLCLDICADYAGSIINGKWNATDDSISLYDMSVRSLSGITPLNNSVVYYSLVSNDTLETGMQYPLGGKYYRNNITVTKKNVKRLRISSIKLSKTIDVLGRTLFLPESRRAKLLIDLNGKHTAKKVINVTR